MNYLEFNRTYNRVLKEATSSAGEGVRILERDKSILPLDQHAIRAAANQLRQAAKELDVLDGMLTAKFWLAKET